MSVLDEKITALDNTDEPISSSNIGTIIPYVSEELPNDAIPITLREVYEVRKKQIAKWSDPSKVWPLAYGPAMGTLAVSLAAFAIHVNIRQLFQIYSMTSFWPTLFPTLIFPTIGHWLATEKLIMMPVLTRPPNDPGGCELCLEIRASVLQMTSGVVLPTALSYLTCSIAAITERTTPVPKLNDPKALWIALKRFGRGTRIFTPVMMLGQVIVGSVLTQQMLDANRRILLLDPDASNQLTIYPSIAK